MRPKPKDSKIASKPTPPQGDPATEEFRIAGVGASAGGLEAFTQLLQHLPGNTGIAFVLVQHLDPAHASMLTEILARETSMPVDQATDGMVIQPDRIYVMQENTDIEANRGKLRLIPRQQEFGQHLPIDRFLRSLAADCGARSIGVILSGTASDGSLGLAAIKGAGGITFAQDEKSARHSGMPRSAIASGCVDYILPPERIAAELTRIGKHPLQESAGPPEPAPQELQPILALLRNATGVNFSGYKQNTIRRRIRRRMLLRNVKDIADYHERLRGDVEELQALYDDLLINITEFFRDPESYAALKTTAWPSILQNRGDASIRIWVPGCSTGEEVYSIAMCLIESMEERKQDVPVQIFATDVSESVIVKARRGIYPENIAQDVSPDRLRRFFTKTDRGYEISKNIRDMCVFARHNLIKDPPFSKLDLISCRNVLIYLDTTLQRKILPVLHYALKPNGFLMLGTSETVGAYSNLFEPAEKNQKLYRKKFSTVRANMEFTAHHSEPAEATPSATEAAWSPADLQREADRLALSHYAPPGVLVDDNMNILQFRGQTSAWLEPAPGAASLNLFKMAREGLLVDLRGAIRKARTSGVPVKKSSLRLDGDRQPAAVEIEVAPLRNPAFPQTFFLVLFRAEPPGRDPGPNAKGRGRDSAEVVRLREDLAATKEYLESIIESQEASNEELRSANEEIQSSNEELQSTNEELETAKEELQSVNEELHTVNDELENRNTELARLNDDLLNLLSSVNIPIMMLDGERRIRTFTPMAQKFLNLAPSDAGRPLRDLKPGLDVPNLDELLLDVMQGLPAKTIEIADPQGRWHSIRIFPYRMSDGRINGAVIVMVEIDQLKRAIDEVRASRDFARAIVETIREPLVVLNSEFRVRTANPSFYQTFQITPAEIEGQPLYEAASRRWNIPKLRLLLEEILPRNARWEDFELEHEFPDLGRKTLLLNARRLAQTGLQEDLILLAIEDITDRRRAEDQLNQAHEAELREAVRSHPHAPAVAAASIAGALNRGPELEALTARLINAQEDERRRLSRELHDHLNQRLAMLEVEVQAEEFKTPAEGPAKARLRSFRAQVAELSDDVRRIAYQLHPSSLDHLGLAVALRSYCADFARREKIQVQFRHRNVPETLPPDIALSLYRITEEALRNVAKHARSKIATVSISRKDHLLELSVRDLGVGFDSGAIARRGGLGIISMEERSRLAGGTLHLQSKPGEGTRIDVRVPLPRKKAAAKGNGSK